MFCFSIFDSSCIRLLLENTSWTCSNSTWRSTTRKSTSLLMTSWSLQTIIWQYLIVFDW